ncbi:hypothetical protein DFH09DRAFT_1498185 [Mycena vulgaris]|nr:hypothetical protein DFH09DRAFT_1498185 [Mycena vulgaris]
MAYYPRALADAQCAASATADACRAVATTHAVVTYRNVQRHNGFAHNPHAHAAADAQRDTDFAYNPQAYAAFLEHTKACAAEEHDNPATDAQHDDGFVYDPHAFAGDAHPIPADTHGFASTCAQRPCGCVRSDAPAGAAAAWGEDGEGAEYPRVLVGEGAEGERGEDERNMDEEEYARYASDEGAEDVDGGELAWGEDDEDDDADDLIMWDADYPSDDDTRSTTPTAMYADDLADVTWNTRTATRSMEASASWRALGAESRVGVHGFGALAGGDESRSVSLLPPRPQSTTPWLPVSTTRLLPRAPPQDDALVPPVRQASAPPVQRVQPPAGTLRPRACTG